MKFLGAKILNDSFVVRKILSRIIQKLIFKKFHVPIVICFDKLEVLDNEDTEVTIDISAKLTSKEKDLEILLCDLISNS